jgi:tetratricopeptide (TPR) repeat protein
MVRSKSVVLLACVVSCLVFIASCAIRFGGRTASTVEPLRISEVVDVGDPARRASLRIVMNGLEADVAGDSDRALGTYEEAIRVDPTNPYAYLAIARHHAEAHDPEWALSFLDKADSLFRAEGGPSLRVEPHLVGLRGQALYASGEVDAALPLLQQAWSSAPDVWDDGRLSADELR